MMVLGLQGSYSKVREYSISIRSWESLSGAWYCTGTPDTALILRLDSDSNTWAVRFNRCLISEKGRWFTQRSRERGERSDETRRDRNERKGYDL